ncbi:hypothetical protein A2U01_0023447, partial [Trifolium medium]|nr:hypothetical protein [Trifolium medium]
PWLLAEGIKELVNKLVKDHESVDLELLRHFPKNINKRDTFGRINEFPML